MTCSAARGSATLTRRAPPPHHVALTRGASSPQAERRGGIAALPEVVQKLWFGKWLHSQSYWHDFRLNLRNAETGDPVAQLEVGKAYLDGKGVEANAAEGRRWLEQAAQQGVNAATSRLEALEIS